MVRDERPREWVAQPPQTGVYDEVRSHDAQVGAEQQPPGRPRAVQVRCRGEQGTADESDVHHECKPHESAGAPSAAGGNQPDEQEVLQSVGHGHPTNGRVGGAEHEYRERERQRDEVHGAVTRWAVGGGPTHERRHTGCHGTRKEEPGWTERDAGAGIEMQLEEGGMRHEPSNAGNSGDDNGSSLDWPHRPDPKCRRGQCRHPEVLLLKMEELPSEEGQKQPRKFAEAVVPATIAPATTRPTGTQMNRTERSPA